MGFSTSGATAIIFVGMLIAAGIAYPVFQTAHDERLSAIDDRDDRLLDVRNTDVVLEAASYEGFDTDDDGVEDAYELTVTATNTGTTTLSVPATDLLVDGEYVDVVEEESEVDEDSSRSLWQPGETLSITVTIDDEPERIKLVTEHGIAEATEVSG